MQRTSDQIKSKLVIKAVRNVRRGYQDDEVERGMYRPGGSSASTPEGLYFGIDMNWRSVSRVVKGKEGRSLLDDAGRAELAELISYWKGKSMSDRQQEAFTGDILKYWKYDGTFLWSHWSELGIPNYEKVFAVGLKGLIEEAESRLAAIDREVPPDYIEQKEFLTAVIISLNALIRFANRYAELARSMASKTADPEAKKRLEEIAATCEWVPENPPKSLVEALQSFFFVHVGRYIEFSTLGIGVRFDKVFGPYYETDLREGKITREGAAELMQLLWVKFHELGLVYSPMLSGIYGGVESLQAITLGGVDDEGNDITNEMTYLVLETAETMHTLEPSIALRYHDGTPTELLSRATDVIRSGIGYPSFFNDKALIPMLESWGVPLTDARDYAVSGCVYIEIPGKNIARRAVGGLVLPKCLWWALHQGRDPKTGRQWGAPTPDPTTFTSVEEVIDAYLEQVRFFFKRQCTIENTCRTLYQKYLPRPFYSALLDGCIEQGKDLRTWAYPSMVHDFCVIIGPTNVVDSIAAIKKVVFEDRNVSMGGLLKALDANWAGYEELRRMMIRAPKFGNDDDFSDDVAVRVHHRTSEALAEFTDRFGNPMRGDGSGVSATYGCAFDTPATPDGRKDGEPFADATLSPSQGRDELGPTAVLKSVSKIDTTKTYNHSSTRSFSRALSMGR
ncbi:MAG: pyruvate formate lyase family protein [Deltaproteobacteria bacterium]